MSLTAGAKIAGSYRIGILRPSSMSLMALL